MSLTTTIEKLYKDTLLPDLLTGLAAGLCVSLFDNFFALKSPTWFGIARFTLLAMLSYVAVAALLNWIWRGRLRHLVPNCILIAVFGSLLLVCIDIAQGVINGWYDPYRVHLSLFDYLAHELHAARYVVVIFTLIALPVSVVTYYAARIVKAVTHWHGEPDKPPSIMSQRVRDKFPS